MLILEIAGRILVQAFTYLPGVLCLGYGCRGFRWAIKDGFSTASAHLIGGLIAALGGIVTNLIYTVTNMDPTTIITFDWVAYGIAIGLSVLLYFILVYRLKDVEREEAFSAKMIEWKTEDAKAQGKAQTNLQPQSDRLGDVLSIGMLALLSMVMLIASDIFKSGGNVNWWNEGISAITLLVSAAVMGIAIRAGARAHAGWAFVGWCVVSFVIGIIAAVPTLPIPSAM